MAIKTLGSNCVQFGLGFGDPARILRHRPTAQLQMKKFLPFVFLKEFRSEIVTRVHRFV